MTNNKNTAKELHKGRLFFNFSVVLHIFGSPTLGQSYQNWDIMKQNQQQIKFSQISSSTFLTKIKTRLVKVGDSSAKAPHAFPKSTSTVAVVRKRPV